MPGQSLSSAERRALYLLKALNLLLADESPLVSVPACSFSAESLDSWGLASRRTSGARLQEPGRGGPKRGARSASPPALQGSRGALATVVWPASCPARRATAQKRNLPRRRKFSETPTNTNSHQLRGNSQETTATSPRGISPTPISPTPRSPKATTIR